MMHPPAAPARRRHLRNLLALVPGLIAVITGLTACSSAGKVKGRVVEGPISIATVVEDSDDRLSSPGIPDVHLELRSVSSSTSKPLASGASGGDGSFSLSPSSGQTLGDQLRINAHRDGYLTTQGFVFTPGDGRQLLIVMKRTDMQPSPAPASTSQDATTRPKTANH